MHLYDEAEIIEMITLRQINEKNNNFIIAGDSSKSILDAISDTSVATFIEDPNKTETLINIKIDLELIKIQDVFKYIISYLKGAGKIDLENQYHISFDNKIDIWRLDRILKKHNIFVQLIFYNVATLTIQEQELFNELYYYFSYNYFVVSLVNDHFNSYFLANNRVLDDREDYQRLVLAKKRRKILIK